MKVLAITLARTTGITGVWTHMRLTQQILRDAGVDYILFEHRLNRAPVPLELRIRARIRAFLTHENRELALRKGPLADRLIRMVQAELKRQKPDLLHVHGSWCGGLLAGFLQAADVPWVAHLHAIDSELIVAAGVPKTHPYTRLADDCLAKTLRHARVCVSVSHDLTRRVEALFPWAEINTIPTPAVLPKGLEGLAGSEPKNYFYMATRLSREKAVDVALRAWRIAQDRLPNIRLLIAGSGPEHQHLRSLALELGLKRCEFLGKIAWHESINMASAALAVLQTTSERRNTREAMPMSVLEAIALGVPVITSDKGGSMEILGDDGMFFRPEDHTELAQSMILLAENPELRRKLSRNLLHRARTQLSPQRFVQQSLQVFEQALSG